MLSPIIESLSGTIKDVKFLKVDVDKNEELIYQYQIQAMPTICIFKDGKLVDKNVGFLPEVALKKFIEKNKN
jgi:thioredoxin 1